MLLLEHSDISIQWVRSPYRPKRSLFSKFLLNKSSRICLTSSQEPSIYQKCFVLEDAHGRVKPIYLDCITSWSTFYAVHEVEFLVDQVSRASLKGHLTSMTVLRTEKLSMQSPGKMHFTQGKKYSRACLSLTPLLQEPVQNLIMSRPLKRM